MLMFLLNLVACYTFVVLGSLQTVDGLFGFVSAVEHGPPVVYRPLMDCFVFVSAVEHGPLVVYRPLMDCLVLFQLLNTALL